MHRGIGTHEGEDEWEEGVGVEEDQRLCRAGWSNPAAKR